MSDFGKAIQTLRKRKNLTQAELASSLNVSGQAVSKWENNLSQPDLDTMQKLMKIFEVSWEEFSALCGYGENEAEEEKKLSERRAQETIAAVAVSATTAANNASEAAKMTARAAEELTTQPKLSGVCAYCGKAMYGEKNVYLKSPKIVCNECAERVTGKITSIKESNRREFKKAMILPAVIVAIVTVVFTAFSFIGGAGGDIFGLASSRISRLAADSADMLGQGACSRYFRRHLRKNHSHAGNYFRIEHRRRNLGYTCKNRTLDFKRGFGTFAFSCRVHNLYDCRAVLVFACDEKGKTRRRG